MLNTPFGNPTSEMRLPKASALKEEFSSGFKTTVQPAAKAFSKGLCDLLRQ